MRLTPCPVPEQPPPPRNELCVARLLREKPLDIGLRSERLCSSLPRTRANQTAKIFLLTGGSCHVRSRVHF